MAIYMNYNEMKVKGNVTAEGFVDTINVLNMRFGLGRSISMEAGSIANREASRPQVTEVTITKLMDQASPGLFKESVTGDAGVKIVIDVVQTGAQKLEKFCTYELEDALISGYDVAVSSDAIVRTVLRSYSPIVTI